MALSKGLRVVQIRREIKLDSEKVCVIYSLRVVQIRREIKL